MHIVLILMGIILSFVMPVIGIAMIMLGLYIYQVREDKDKHNREKEETKRQETLNYYASSKWSHPTSQETIAAAVTLNENPLCTRPNHKAFLRRQIDRLETEFNEKRVYANFPQITNINSTGDGIDSLFETPAKYIDVAEFTGHVPISELIEDWTNQIIEDERSRQTYKEYKQKFQQELLTSVKKRIIELAQEGCRRKEIIGQVKSENSDVKGLIISRVNGIWQVDIWSEKIDFKI